MKPAYALLGLALLCSCSSSDSLDSPSSISNESSSLPDTTITASSISVESLEFSLGDQTSLLTLGDQKSLFLDLNLSDGRKFRGITTDFTLSDDSLSGDILWYSNDSSVATVSGRGVVIARGVGETTVIATFGNKSAVVHINVSADFRNVTAISLARTNLSFTTVHPHSLLVNVDFLSAGDQTESYKNLSVASLLSQLDCESNLTSTNPNVLSVSETGIINPISNGSATILYNCENFKSELNVNVSAFKEATPGPETEADDIALTNLTMTNLENEFIVGDNQSLYVDLSLDDDSTIYGVTWGFDLNDQTQSLTWESSDESVATVTKGQVTFLSYGTVTITASYLDIETSLDMVVKMASQTADDASDYFLNSDDIYTDAFSIDSGFGYDDFPDVIYGPPVGSLDVVSFGTEGKIIIELNGYHIVDGVGPDFTIFENPFSGWQECAKVAVSDNGTDYHEFGCQKIDETGLHSGCAGVTNVNYGLSDTDYLDPSLSGGDVFDLANLDSPLSTVQFVKITHVGFCRLEDNGSTANPGAGNAGGFDLDAMAIVNGQND